MPCSLCPDGYVAPVASGWSQIQQVAQSPTLYTTIHRVLISWPVTTLASWSRDTVSRRVTSSRLKCYSLSKRRASLRVAMHPASCGRHLLSSSGIHLQLGEVRKIRERDLFTDLVQGPDPRCTWSLGKWASTRHSSTHKTHTESERDDMDHCERETCSFAQFSNVKKSTVHCLVVHMSSSRCPLKGIEILKPQCIPWTNLNPVFYNFHRMRTLCLSKEKMLVQKNPHNVRVCGCVQYLYCGIINQSSWRWAWRGFSGLRSHKH